MIIFEHTHETKAKDRKLYARTEGLLPYAVRYVAAAVAAVEAGDGDGAHAAAIKVFRAMRAAESAYGPLFGGDMSATRFWEMYGYKLPVARAMVYTCGCGQAVTVIGSAKAPVATFVVCTACKALAPRTAGGGLGS